MCYDNKEWCKIWRGIDLSFQNWHEEFDEFWPEHSKTSKVCTLMGCFWPKYIMSELEKCREVMLDGTEDWCKICKKTGLYFQKLHEEFGKFSFTSDFIIESKMAKLNQKQNSKQPDRPDAVWKLYFALEIN